MMIPSINSVIFQQKERRTMTENNTAEHQEEKTGFWLPPVQRHKWGEHQVCDFIQV